MKGKTIFFSFISIILICFFFFLIIQKNVYAPDTPHITTLYMPDSFTTCSDGTCTETLYSDRMFYQENGSWNPINTTIIPSNDTYWNYEMNKNEFKVFFKDNINSGKANRFYNKDYWFEYDLSGGKMQWDTPKSISAIKSSIGVVSDNYIRYNNAFSDTDIEYEIFPEMLKEKFYLNTLPKGGSSGSMLQYIGEVGFSDSLIVWANGQTQPDKTFTTQDRIDFKNASNTTIFYLNKPIAYYYIHDNVTNETITNSTDITYDVKVSGGKIQFILDIPYDFLLNAVYPVIIDPTVYYNFTTAGTNKGYAVTADTGTTAGSVPTSLVTTGHPTLADIYGFPPLNMTAAGYLGVSAIGGTFATLNSTAANREPFLVSNFTTKSSATINWINATSTLRMLASTDDGCWMEIGNWTNTAWTPVGTIVTDTSNFLTRSINITTAADINKFVDSNNLFAILDWGQNADSGEGCQVDFVSVVVNYNSTMTFASPATNVTSNSAPNTPVNFTITATTNDDDISHYLFSNNFSGSWSNTTWYEVSGTQTSFVINASNTSSTAGIYGWQFCANSSSNFVNCSDVQYFNFTTKTLHVSWTPYNAQSEINDTTCIFGSPCSFTQYSTFNASGNVTCKTNPTGQSCGSITGGLMFNNTSTTFAYVNTTADASPFYIVGGIPTTCVNLTNLGDTEILQNIPNGNYGNLDHMLVRSQSSTNVRLFIKFNTSLGNSTPINITTATLFLYYYAYSVNPAGRIYNLYNTTDNTSMVDSPWCEGTGSGVTCLTWNNQTSVDTLQSQTVVPASYGWMSWTIGQAINTSFNVGNNISLTIRDSAEDSSPTSPDSWFYTKENSDANKPYLTVCYTTAGVLNPSSLGSLSDGSSYLLNYTVNFTTPSGFYNLTFNFSSSTDPNPPVNRTADAFVMIGAAGPVTTLENLLEPVSYSEKLGFSSQFNRSVTQFGTFSDNLGKFWNSINSATSSSSFSDLLSHFYSRIASLTDYATYSDLVSKLSNFYKSVTQYGTYGDVLSKFGTIFSSVMSNSTYSDLLSTFSIRMQSLASSLAYSEQLSKFSQFYNTVSDFITYLESIVSTVPSAKTLISITSSLSYGEIQTKFGTFFQSLTTSGTYTDLIQKIYSRILSLWDSLLYGEVQSAVSNIYSLVITNPTTANPMTVSSGQNITITFNFTNITGQPILNTSACSGVVTNTITLNEVNNGNIGDAGTNVDYPDTNFGSDASFVAGANATMARAYGFTLWNLSVIPAGATITNANLSLDINFADVSEFEYLDAYNTSNNWVENTITWNNQPALSVKQDTIENVTNGVQDIRMNWTVTDAVVYQYNQANKNLSLVVKYNNSQVNNDFIRYYSKEINNVSLSPQLIVTYSSMSNCNVNVTNITVYNSTWSGVCSVIQS